MKYVRTLTLTFFAQLLLIGMACAQVHGTAAEAKTLAEKGIAHIKAVGVDKAFEDFTAKDGKWQDKDLYIFVIKYDGTMMAHGANKALVGKPMLEMKDANGVPFTAEMAKLAKTKGTGWVDYMWPNPLTKKTEQKSSYAIAIPNYEGFLGVGIYK